MNSTLRNSTYPTALVARAATLAAPGLVLALALTAATSASAGTSGSKVKCGFLTSPARVADARTRT